MGRIPLSVKLIYTAWLALWMESPLLISAQAVGVLFALEPSVFPVLFW